jgi:predicted metal-dependent hydrolase
MDAKAKFKQRVRDWSLKIGVEVAWLGIRPMRRKWASCSTNGHLNFSTELLAQPAKVQDYVIVHELLHLRVPNHGKLWKSLMRGYLGEWEVVREEMDAMELERPGRVNYVSNFEP